MQVEDGCWGIGLSNAGRRWWMGGWSGESGLTKTVSKKLGNIKWLRELSADDQAHFYTLAKGMSGVDVEILCQRTIVASRTITKHDRKEREWQPLTVWKSRGYDAEAIEANDRPENRSTDPEFGWPLFRVTSCKDLQDDKVDLQDKTSFQRKKKTRALRRRRTDESSHEKSDSEEFSQEELSDSSDDRGAKGRGRAKSVAKAKKHPKEKKANKDTKAKEQLKSKAGKAKEKITKALSELRQEVRHENILDVASEVLEPVKAYIKDLAGFEKALAKVQSTGIDKDDTIHVADKFDFKTCKSAKGALKSALKKIERKG